MRTFERRVPFTGEPLETAAALARASVEPHVVYENRGAVSFAEGEVEVVTGGFEDLARFHGRTAYGWVTFERAGYLAVPRDEILFGDGSALLRSADEESVLLLEKRLAAVSPILAGQERVVAPIETSGAQEYRAAVASAVADIKAGLLEKVILSRIVPLPEDLDFPATYLVGRRGNDPARSFLLRLGGWEALGFSPEVVTSVDAAGEVVTQPLAGTRALVDDAVFDVARREELYRDAKEVFEHAISVRLAAAELTGVCGHGSVKVADFMSIKERGSVQHLASEVTGTLAPDRSPWDALAALFPAVTASGIPKAEACSLIAKVEPERGLYSGAVVRIDADGSLDAALVLRSLFRRDGLTWLRAGAGIVAQSTPERELEETVEKLRSVSRFLVPSCV